MGLNIWCSPNSVSFKSHSISVTFKFCAVRIALCTLEPCSTQQKNVTLLEWHQVFRPIILFTNNKLLRTFFGIPLCFSYSLIILTQILVSNHKNFQFSLFIIPKNMIVVKLSAYIYILSANVSNVQNQFSNKDPTTSGSSLFFRIFSPSLREKK